jgi:ribosomal protein L7/L12
MQNPQLDIQVKALIAAGKMIEAMQLVMKILGCGLKEGKDYVDKFR